MNTKKYLSILKNEIHSTVFATVDENNISKIKEILDKAETVVMEVNLRCDSFFVEDKAWHESSKRYREFLESDENQIDRIIFNVFKDEDRQIYEKLLCSSK